MSPAAQRSYDSSPVLLPERWGNRGKEATRRRRRRSPVIIVLIIAALTVLPFIAYITSITNAAHIGYHILRLTQDIAALDSEHERLQAIASSLRAPDRIEQLAVTRLGLRAPRASQIAALPLPPSPTRSGPPKPPGLLERLGAYLHRNDAAAAEPSR